LVSFQASISSTTAEVTLPEGPDAVRSCDSYRSPPSHAAQPPAIAVPCTNKSRGLFLRQTGVLDKCQRVPRPAIRRGQGAATTSWATPADVEMGLVNPVAPTGDGRSTVVPSPS